MPPFDRLYRLESGQQEQHTFYPLSRSLRPNPSGAATTAATSSTAATAMTTSTAAAVVVTARATTAATASTASAATTLSFHGGVGNVLQGMEPKSR